MKITPTARLVLSADAPRDEWLAERTKGITATDVPAIQGLSRYKTAIDVWMEKVNPTPSDFDPAIGNGEAALWGIKFEDVVARTWAEDKGWSVRRVGIIAHHEHDWMRASLDRLVTGCPDGRCAVEVKTRSSYAGEEWDKGVPADVAAQVAWQLIVSGLDHEHVIALIGGQRLVEHVIKRTDFEHEPIIDLAQLVWDAVQIGEAPKLPATMWTDEYLEQLHPDRGGEIEVGDDVANLAIEYQYTNSQIKLLDEKKNQLRTLLIGALGEAESATSNGRSLFTYKSTTARRLDTKKLAEIHPDAVADDRVWSTTTTRTLRLTARED